MWPHADVVELPLADGGEGTVAALAHALGGELVPVRTSNALGEPVVAQIGFVAGRRLAVVGASDACGIELIPRERRDAEAASTLGAGPWRTTVRKVSGTCSRRQPPSCTWAMQASSLSIPAGICAKLFTPCRSAVA